MQIERIRYFEWDDCLRLVNGSIELIVPRGFGIRILHFGFMGRRNEFAVFPQGSHADQDDWLLYGGHRLWTAPESPESKRPDNDPVRIGELKNGLRVTQATDFESGLMKEIEVLLHPSRPMAAIRHRALNLGQSIQKIALWGISALVPGGTGVLPLPKPENEQNGLTAHGSIAIWPYSNLGDGHISFDERFVLLRSPTRQRQKVGVACTEGWGAYLHDGHLFLKSFVHQTTASYPDRGSSAEIYCDQQLIELESLGPLVDLAPGGTLEHQEAWLLRGDVPLAQDLPAFRESAFPFVQDCLQELRAWT